MPESPLGFSLLSQFRDRLCDVARHDDESSLGLPVWNLDKIAAVRVVRSFGWLEIHGTTAAAAHNRAILHTVRAPFAVAEPAGCDCDMDILALCSLDDEPHGVPGNCRFEQVRSIHSQLGNTKMKVLICSKLSRMLGPEHFHDHQGRQEKRHGENRQHGPQDMPLFAQRTSCGFGPDSMMTHPIRLLFQARSQNSNSSFSTGSIHPVFRIASIAAYCNGKDRSGTLLPWHCALRRCRRTLQSRDCGKNCWDVLSRFKG